MINDFTFVMVTDSNSNNWTMLAPRPQNGEPIAMADLGDGSYLILWRGTKEQIEEAQRKAQR